MILRKSVSAFVLAKLPDSLIFVNFSEAVSCKIKDILANRILPSSGTTGNINMRSRQ